MPNTLKSNQLFHIINKTLDKGLLHRCFGKSVRYMQMWAADPRCCEVTRRNPFDSAQALFDHLDDHGRIDVVRGALEYMIGNLPLRVVSSDTAISDKGSIDGEIADITRAMGRLATVIEDARADGRIDTTELIRIKREASQLKIEVDQLLDAAGIKGGV